MRLEDLRDALGGEIHIGDHRMWLDTRIGGLRTFVVRRLTEKFEMAVFSPGAREFDPFRKAMNTISWSLDGETIPRLDPPFVFAGWHRGALFAKALDEPSLEGMVTTLWRLADLARRLWAEPKRQVLSRRERFERLRDTWEPRINNALLLVLLAWAIASC